MAPAALEQRYAQLCQQYSDIHEHLPTLRRLASQCEHITEMGVRSAISTAALLVAQPARLVCYDFHDSREWIELSLLRGATDFVFLKANVLLVTIEPTEMLFIDTRHTYAQLSSELGRHAASVAKFIALHDTATFGKVGEDGGHGLTRAIDEFVSLGKFSIRECYDRNNGLVVLERS